jgi:hypothetical protein
VRIEKCFSSYVIYIVAHSKYEILFVSQIPSLKEQVQQLEKQLWETTGVSIRVQSQESIDSPDPFPELRHQDLLEKILLPVRRPVEPIPPLDPADFSNADSEDSSDADSDDPIGVYY